jgi:hypothetical protein
MKILSCKYYSINDCPVNELTKIILKLILLDYNFIVKERNHLSYCNHENLALHIDAVNVADGDYGLVPADSLVTSEVNLNCANVNQDLGQAPEDSQPDSAQKSKPRCITYYFPHYYLRIYIF